LDIVTDVDAQSEPVPVTAVIVTWTLARHGERSASCDHLQTIVELGSTQPLVLTVGVMTDINEDSLPVLLNSIQSRLVSSQRQLSIVNAQMKGRAREAKLQELTMEQLQGLGDKTRVYKGVGKM